MKTHEELICAIEGLSSFRHWAQHAMYIGADGEFEAGMEAGKGAEYEAARLGLGKVLPVLTDADAVELLLKVTRRLPPFKTFAPDPDYPFKKARSHYEDFSTSARDALLYWDALKALALRLEAREMAETKTMNPPEVNSKQVSLPHGMAAILYARHRTGLKEGSTYPGKRIIAKLKSPEHRIGKEYRRQSVIDLAAADEKAAAAEDDRKLEKLRGKNKNPVTYKF